MKDAVHKKLAYLEFLNRENGFRHHKYDEEMRQYEYLKNGDMRSIDESVKRIRAADIGHLSDDPVKNLLYQCICNITLVTRFSIEGGMDSEKLILQVICIYRNMTRPNRSKNCMSFSEK